MEKKKFTLKEIGLPRLVMLLLAGILLILLTFPGIFGSKKIKDEPTKDIINSGTENDMNTTSCSTNTYIEEMESKLCGILRKVSGIGEVEVMITLKNSKEQVPLKDRPYTQEGLNELDGEGGNRTNNKVQRDESTILVTNDDGNEVPYIISEIEPEVEGVLVVAEGGDDAEIILDIMETVEVLFDVPAHKVKVMRLSNIIN